MVCGKFTLNWRIQWLQFLDITEINSKSCRYFFAIYVIDVKIKCLYTMCQIEWVKAPEIHEEMKEICIKLHWRFLKFAQKNVVCNIFPSCDALKWSRHTITGVRTVLNDPQNSLSTKIWWFHLRLGVWRQKCQNWRQQHGSIPLDTDVMRVNWFLKVFWVVSPKWKSVRGFYSQQGTTADNLSP